MLHHEVDGLLRGQADAVVGEVLIILIMEICVHVRGRVEIRGSAVIKHQITLGCICDWVADYAEASSQLLFYVTSGAEGLVVVQPGDNGA